MTDIVYNKNGVPFNIDDIATDLNGKADKDLGNIDSAGTARASGWGAPSTRVVSDIFSATVTTSTEQHYTAPADGFIQIECTSSALGRVGIVGLGNLCFLGYVAGGNIEAFFRVGKGQEVFIVGWTGNISLVYSRFIYAQGA